MGVVCSREAFRIPPTLSICVVTRAPVEVGGEGTTLLLVYLFSSVFSFVRSFVGCFFGSWLARFRQSFPPCLSVFTDSARYFLCVPRFSIVAEFDILLPRLFWSFFFSFLAFYSSFALSSSFVLWFSRRGVENRVDREKEREGCVFLLLVMDWSFVVDCEAQIRSWLEEDAEEGVKKKAESLLAMIHPRSFSVTASWSARV
jgi:hypothetical protein